VPGGVVMPKPSRHEIEIDAQRVIEVIEPGMMTTVQDHGRPGWQHIGVTPGGAADPVMARVANLLVGNPPDAALLECAMQGPVLHVPAGACVAWTGWSDPASGRPHISSDDEVVDLRGRMGAPHGYFAIAGGIEVPRVLGSRATDLRAGFGGWHGRPLRAGDRLPVGREANGPLSGAWRVGWPAPVKPGAVIELRFLPGVQLDWFGDETLQAFRTSIYQTTPMSDRTGARLSGPKLILHKAREMVSQPVAAGSVQVPPDGMPIMLMAERQTIGGYPQIGHVISADLPLLARAWPGTKIRFREVTLEEARAAWREMQREISLLQTGLRLCV
jgi:antagonist of KipI